MKEWNERNIWNVKNEISSTMLQVKNVINEPSLVRMILQCFPSNFPCSCINKLITFYMDKAILNDQRQNFAGKPFAFNLKCIWHEKLLLLIWKAFQCRVQWRFLFWNIFFRFGDIDVFVVCKLATRWRHVVDLLQMRKYWFNNISGNICVVLFKLGTRDLNQTANKMNPVAWLSWLNLLGTSPFPSKKQISQLAISKSEREVPIGTDALTILSKRFLKGFLGVDDFCCETKRKFHLIIIWKGPVTKLLLWQQHDRCHFAPLLTQIDGAKFEDHSANISRDIIDSVFVHF